MKHWSNEYLGKGNFPQLIPGFLPLLISLKIFHISHSANCYVALQKKGDFHTYRQVKMCFPVLGPRAVYHLFKDFNPRNNVLSFKDTSLGFSVVEICSGSRSCFVVLLIMHFQWRIKACILFEIAKLCCHFFTSLAYRNNSLFIALRWHAFRILLKLNSPSLLCYSKPFVVRVVNRICYLSWLKLKFSLLPFVFPNYMRRMAFYQKVLYLGIKFFVLHQ